jgi:hypothetical protein
MTEEVIQFILASHWNKHSAPRISRRLKEKFNLKMSADKVNETIKKYTLRHHGKPVQRKSWPCPK